MHFNPLRGRGRLGVLFTQDPGSSPREPRDNLRQEDTCRHCIARPLISFPVWSLTRFPVDFRPITSSFPPYPSPQYCWSQYSWLHILHTVTARHGVTNRDSSLRAWPESQVNPLCRYFTTRVSAEEAPATFDLRRENEETKKQLAAFPLEIN